MLNTNSRPHSEKDSEGPATPWTGGDSRNVSKIFGELLKDGQGYDFDAVVGAASYLVALMQLCRYSTIGALSNLSFAEAEKKHAKAIDIHLRSLRACQRSIFARRHTLLIRIWTDLSSFLNEDTISNPFLLPDLYLDLKEWSGNPPTAVSSKLGKISGGEYLRRTQFFTEEYMCDFLAACSWRSVTEDAGDTIPSLVDPACGAGNLLIAALAEGVRHLARRGHTAHQAAKLLFPKIIGYDIDPVVARIAAATLTLEFVRLTGKLPARRATIFAGTPSGQLGLFSDREFARIEKAVGTGRRIVATNPPFLGKRLMDPVLKDHIKEHYPEAKADLCTAFSLRCSQLLRPGDVLALVHQNAFWHLDSLRLARERLEASVPLQISITLGSRAFRHLSGEKASVSLSLFSASRPQAEGAAVRLDLSSLDLAGKKTALRALAVAFPGGDLTEALGDTGSASVLDASAIHRGLLKKKRYDDWAVPMQGTSTGNNKLAVRYSWQVASHDTDWVSVSKGGGYCRWWGLNRYAVLWGRNGEKIRQFPGHALRNVDVIDQSPLVYSDTGTLGLNVRLRQENQVFIASGPGIRVTGGDEWAHLAYLNSRIASSVLKRLNPKLTIAAGYIKKLPFSDDLAKHPENSRLAHICVDAKRRILSRKLANDDCMVPELMATLPEDFDDYFVRELAADLGEELSKLKAEAEIERNVRIALRISSKDMRLIHAHLGHPKAVQSARNKNFSVQELDGLLYNILSPSCQYRGRIRHGSAVGVDGPLEVMAVTSGIQPAALVEMLLKHVHDLEHVRSRYLEDLLHKMILDSLGFKSNQCWREKSLGIGALVDRLNRRFHSIQDTFSRNISGQTPLRDWIRRRLPTLHAETFLDSPFLHVEGDSVRLARTV